MLVSLFNLECNGIYAWNIYQTQVHSDISVDMSVAGLENLVLQIGLSFGLTCSRDCTIYTYFGPVLELQHDFKIFSWS